MLYREYLLLIHTNLPLRNSPQVYGGREGWQTY